MLLVYSIGFSVSLSENFGYIFCDETLSKKMWITYSIADAYSEENMQAKNSIKSCIEEIYMSGEKYNA